MGNNELINSINKIGKPFFSEPNLKLLSDEIIISNLSIVDYIVMISQQNNQVRLECSMLTNKSLIDFTLINNSIEKYFIPYSHISYIKEDTFPNIYNVSIFNTSGVGSIIYYSMANPIDFPLLKKYLNNLKNFIQNS